MLSPQPTDVRSPAPVDDVAFSRRGLGKRLLLGASAVAVLLASGKHETLQAAPLTDDWHLGGNLAVNTDGTNFIGTKNVAPLIFKTAATNNTPIERMRITPAGNIGIGTTAPAVKLHVEATTTIAVLGRHSVATGAQPGVQGDTLATVAGATGVYGLIRPTSPGADAAGVRGINSGTNANGVGVRGTHAGSGHGIHGSSVRGVGVMGETASTLPNASGVLGRLTSTAPGTSSAGVLGENKGTNVNGAGVLGTHAGGGIGVVGVSASGNGLQGQGTNGVVAVGSSTGVSADGGSGIGVNAKGGYTAVNAIGGSYGVIGIANTGYGVYGSGSTHGLYGSGTTGVFGTSTKGSGVHGNTSETNSSAVYGTGGQYGVRGANGRTAGVRGDSNYVGVWGAGTTFGVYGETPGASESSYGVFGISDTTTGYAGYFQGRVAVTGTLSKGGGSFKIDHPLDPENKYLSHSFVESPDMMNVYNGNVTTDARGEATVELPVYFGALNRDFRYQLTTIGGYAPVYIAEKIEGNRFKIAGGKAGLEVSWQVTGIRQDAFANANRIPTEEAKPARERGTFLHPDAFGKPETMSIARLRSPQAPGDKLPAANQPEPPIP